jgi:transposase-like protein
MAPSHVESGLESHSNPDCPYCGSGNTHYRHDHSDPETSKNEGVVDGTPVYKCRACLSYFVEANHS